MGEYADDYVDYLLGQDYHDELNDPFGDYDDVWPGMPFRPFRPHRKTCQRCGQRDLIWVWKIPGEWRLAEPSTGEVHACPSVDPDDFPDLS